MLCGIKTLKKGEGEKQLCFLIAIEFRRKQKGLVCWRKARPALAMNAKICFSVGIFVSCV